MFGTSFPWRLASSKRRGILIRGSLFSLFLFPLTISLGVFIHFHSFRFYYMLMIYRCDFTSQIILLSYRSVYVAACWKSMLRWINSHLIFTLSILEFIIFHQICFSCVFSFKELPSYSPGCSNQALGVLLSFFLFLNQVLRGHTSQYLLN